MVVASLEACSLQSGPLTTRAVRFHAGRLSLSKGHISFADAVMEPLIYFSLTGNRPIGASTL